MEEPTEKSSLATPTPTKSTLTEDVELTIKRLLAQLPPLDHKKTEYDNESASEIEPDFDENDEKRKEFIPKCTCTLREVKEDEEGTDNKTEEHQQRALDNPVNIEINIIKDSDEELADAERERLKLRAGRKRKREKVVKSIFDLDDDNEEVEVGEMSDSGDDLESVPEETDTKDVIAVLAAGESLSQHSNAIAATQSQVLETNNGEEIPVEMPQFSKFEAVIDPDCAAMRYYETDRNEVTNYHIMALHDRFVPNVNGNWNQREVPESELSSQVKAAAEENEAADGNLGVSIDTANRVVPRYSFLVCDKIPKQFPDFHCDYKTYRAKCKARARVRRIEARLAKHERLQVTKGEETDSEPENADDSMNGDNTSVPVVKLEENSSDIEMQSPTTTTPAHAMIESSEEEQEEDTEDCELSESNNQKLPSFNELSPENETGTKPDTNHEFSEWYQSVQAVSNGEDLIILPYVVID